MSLKRPASMQQNHIVNDWHDGDIPDFAERPMTAIDSATGITLTGVQVAAGDYERTGAAGGGIADTLPSAQQLISALAGNKNIVTPPFNELYGLQPNRSVPLQWPGGPFAVLARGSTFRRIVRNNVGQVITMTAPASSGILTSGTMTIAASKWREFLFIIGASAAAATLAATTTNGNAILTNVDVNLISQLTPGMSIYGTGIAAGATIRSVNLDTGTVTMSANATADGTLIGVSFTPTITIQNLRAGDL